MQGVEDVSHGGEQCNGRMDLQEANTPPAASPTTPHAALGACGAPASSLNWSCSQCDASLDLLNPNEDVIAPTATSSLKHIHSSLLELFVHSHWVSSISVTSQENPTVMVQVNRAIAPLLRDRFPSLSARALDAQVRAMVRSLGCPGGPWDVGVMLTSDAHMRQLNRKFRQKDKPTDILSFPFHKISKPGRFPRVASREERYLGDIYISPAYVQQQCERGELDDDVTLETRMPVLLAHGLCHLLGYDHEKDDEFERMQKAEAYILIRYKQFLETHREKDPTHAES